MVGDPQPPHSCWVKGELDGRDQSKRAGKYRESIEGVMNREVVLVTGENDAEVKTLDGNEVLKWRVMGIVGGPPGDVKVTWSLCRTLERKPGKDQGQR